MSFNLDIINNSLSNLLSCMTDNNNHSSMIISIENTPTMNLIKKQDKIIKTLKLNNNKLLAIIDILQNKIVDNDVKIKDLETTIIDKKKLVEILTKNIIANDNSNDRICDYLCLGCCENPRTNLFLPCRHLSYCDKCIVNSTKCPICRDNFSEIKKIYY
jgi:hypothetical protein